MKADAERLIALLEPLPVGGLLTYKEIERALEKPYRDCLPALYRARAELQRHKNRLIRCERGKGYRIAPAAECVTVAAEYHRAGRRKIEKAHRAVRFADLKQLTHEQQQVNLAMLRVLGNMSAAIRSLQERSAEHDQAIDSLRGEAHSQEDRLASIERILGLRTAEG